jgi:hypothetical protein
MTDEKQSPLPSPESKITHIRVGFAFPAEIANLAMARHKVDIIAIRPELARDRGDQIVKIALGKVRATDRAFEQQITDKGQLGILIDDRDMAGRMAGAMNDVKLMACEL